ncbi:TPA: 30S ribosomal protein S19 [Candidatus Woesearchaeota archaeon]|nr:30S ribosomal protein S19 [Candidatus Woesearchaeota archaeon]HII68278.1 30S ribosomal protein S19 [Candidatus Woesearchaeota archaeon]
MARKAFTYQGMTLEELMKLSVQEFAELVPARQRRSLRRGLTEPQKVLLKHIRSKKASVKTHTRDMVIIPEMVGITIRIYQGKDFVPIAITEEMVGHFLGEYAMTRKSLKHNAPGIGATKSSSSLSVR